MRKLEIAASLGLIFAIFFGSLSDFSGMLSHLREDVLRLHILANSDSEEDQSLKLLVRDELLRHSETLFSGCDTPEEIRERAIEKRETIRLLAQEVLEKNGSDAQVSVQLVHMDFDEKQYDTITMPAGEYDALRILIGEARGKNWWCVMYPPLCLPVAGKLDADEDAAEVYFDEDTLDILENPPKFRIRFKCLEWWDALREHLMNGDAAEFPQSTDSVDPTSEPDNSTPQENCESE